MPLFSCGGSPLAPSFLTGDGEWQSCQTLAVIPFMRTSHSFLNTHTFPTNNRQAHDAVGIGRSSRARAWPESRREREKNTHPQNPHRLP